MFSLHWPKLSQGRLSVVDAKKLESLKDAGSVEEPARELGLPAAIYLHNVKACRTVSK
jgi:hypothetical protein